MNLYDVLTRVRENKLEDVSKEDLAFSILAIDALSARDISYIRNNADEINRKKTERRWRIALTLELGDWIKEKEPKENHVAARREALKTIEEICNEREGQIEEEEDND